MNDLKRRTALRAQHEWSRSAAFFGNLIVRRQFPLFRVDALAIPARAILTTHSHPLACVSVLLRGGGVEVLDDRKIANLPGTAVFRPAGMDHSNEFGPQPTSWLAFALSGGLLSTLELHGIQPQTAVWCQGSLISYLGWKIMREMRNSEASSLLAMEGLTMEVIAELFRSKLSPKPSPIERAESMLRECFREEISLSRVADAIGINPAQLARDFRRRYGSAVGDYIRKLRLEFVVDKLASSSVSIGEISYEAGFADHSHLTRAFKARFGITPAQFRAAVRRC